MSDWTEDPTARAWIRNVLENMAPNMAKSAVVMSVVPDSGKDDVKYWVELGASIMLDKPIVVVVFGDRPLPVRLERVADEVVRLEHGVTPAGSDQLAAAMRRVLGQ